MRRETRSMSLYPHSTPVLVEKSIDERNMGRQNRSGSVKVLESRRMLLDNLRKRKSKGLRVDGVEGKRKRTVEDEINLGFKKKKFKNISPTIEELRRFTLYVGVNDEYQKYLTSRNREILPIDDGDDFVTPSPKQIKEPVPPKKASGVQPIDYDRELQKLKADVKQVGGSKGKDIPYSQGDTNAHYRNNIVLDAANQLGVNIMEETSAVKVNMFVAKLTFTPDVAHAGAIGKTADEAAGEMEAESEKEKVPESQTGVVCVTASVDEAAGEMKEQSEKVVPEYHIVQYQDELLPEVSPQMKKKKKRCPVKAVQSPFIIVFDSGSSTGIVAAKEKKQIYAVKHHFQSKIGNSINSSLLNVFAARVIEGKYRKKNEIYPNHVRELNPAYDLGEYHVEDKK
ncbi:hypothetical protein A4A49_04164 [Nicotiana attenuata]|uniref:Uncharacterized protein n=1 Tax=Nicotiana attenuata TaxID=49451 RepID=A0A1J6I4Z7_NICAT|nr:hypothetical protein A4A49_04164 [Nicotiana attenuata]